MKGRRVVSWALGIVAAAVAVAAAVDAALWLTDWDDLLIRPPLIKAAHDKGYDLAFTQPIRLRLLPKPQASVRRVTIKPLADASVSATTDVAVTISLHRLLQGVVETNITLDDGNAKGPTLAIDHIAAHIAIEGKLSDATLDATGQVLGLRGKVGGRMGAPDPSGHRPAAATLQLGELKAGFDGTVDVLKPGIEAIGHATLEVGQLAGWIETLAAALGKPAPDLPKLARAPFEMSADIDTDLVHRATALSNVAIRIGDTRADGTFTVARTPTLKVDGRLHFPTLSFNDLQSAHPNWIALTDLFIARTTQIIDNLPPEGAINLALDIDDGRFNGQSSRDIALRAEMHPGQGSISHLSARLPGDSLGSLTGTMSGGPGAREIAGKFSLQGRRPGDILLWLSPALATASTRAAPFTLAGEVAPTGRGSHTGKIDVTLDGIHGQASSTLVWGTPATVRSSFAIEAVDLLSYFSLPPGLDIANLWLRDLTLDSALTIDPSEAKPIAVQEAALRLGQLAVRLPAGPPLTLAPAVDGLPIDLHALAAWLAELPQRAGARVQDHVRRSVLAKLFPAIEADLSRIDGAIEGLNFQRPVTASVGLVTVDRAQKGSSAAESLGLFGGLELKLAS